MQDDDAAFLSLLGHRLRSLRTGAGLTRRRLADASGVSERYIAQMEAGEGNASVLTLRALAAALGVTATDLLAAAVTTEPDAPAAERPARIALIGLRGAGKSSLGRALAERRRVSFIELDQEVEREAGASLSAIFELHGQNGFRRLERAVLERLIGTREAMVVAAGGGIVADARNYDLLLASCLTVWVRASPEEHMARVIAQGDLRPMAGSAAAMDDLRAILTSREALYRRADLVLDTSGRGFGECLDELTRQVRA